MRTEIEIQKENVTILLNLIKENPELRILPMVDCDVIASDEYTSWVGSFGKAEVDLIWNDGERIYINSHDEEELIQNELDDIDRTIDDSIAEALAEEIVKNYNWEKVIVVWIGLP